MVHGMRYLHLTGFEYPDSALANMHQSRIREPLRQTVQRRTTKSFEPLEPRSTWVEGDQTRERGRVTRAHRQAGADAKEETREETS